MESHATFRLFLNQKIILLFFQERELAFQHRRDAGIRMESELPHLVALENDLLSTGILLYHLKVSLNNSINQPMICFFTFALFSLKIDGHCKEKPF